MSLIGTYVSALLIVAVAVVLGRAVCLLAGRPGTTAAAPAVGFAALMILCDVAIRLPGGGWTAVGSVVLVAVTSIVLSRRRAAWPSLRDTALVALLVLFLISVPFLANDRVGILGVSVLNDSHWHLVLAEGLRWSGMSTYGYGFGYPLGPHAVAATFAQGLGTDVDKTLTGVLMATPILTGLTALGLPVGLPRAQRALVATLAAVAYMAAAWYVQSALKEPIVSLLLVGIVVVLARREEWTGRRAALVPLAVLIAGTVYDYSYLGLIWPATILALWLALELGVGGAWRHVRGARRELAAAAPVVGLGLVLLIALVAPDLARIYHFWKVNGAPVGRQFPATTPAPLGNLVVPLHAREGLNLWLTGNFKLSPGGTVKDAVLPVFALVVLAFALLRSLQRRELAWPAAILACGLIYLYAKHTQTPYIAAKALVIPAPLIVLGSGMELLRSLHRTKWRSFTTLVAAGAAAAYFFFVLDSSYHVLRDGTVGPVEHQHELRALRPALHHSPTLSLLNDSYANWELRGQPVSVPLLFAPIIVPINPAKPWSEGQALDFDSVTAPTLDEFDYVVTARTDDQSTPPPNFRLVAAARSYEVWHRVGPTPTHAVLAESGAPGAVLDCRTPAGRKLEQAKGYALVKVAPRYFNVSSLRPGGAERVALSLPPGRWDLSLPYESPQSVAVHTPGLDVRLPPSLVGKGVPWPVGAVLSTGTPIAVTFKVADPGLVPSGSQRFKPRSLAAISVTAPRKVPLRQACGRYVDWYVIG